jgi:hypothetical protein
MPLLEDHTASFIVRIWRESGETPGSSDWRGSIEHVPSGQRSFFRDLGAIAQFMKPHLNDLGIDPSSRFWELMSVDTPNDPSAHAPVAPARPVAKPKRRAAERG